MEVSLDKIGLDAAITLGLNRVIAVDISDSEWVKRSLETLLI